MRITVAKAAYDDDASVWFVEHSDLEGFRMAGETFEAFRQNGVDATTGLLPEERDGDILIEIVVHASTRAAVRGISESPFGSCWASARQIAKLRRPSDQ